MGNEWLIVKIRTEQVSVSEDAHFDRFRTIANFCANRNKFLVIQIDCACAFTMRRVNTARAVLRMGQGLFPVRVVVAIAESGREGVLVTTSHIPPLESILVDIIVQQQILLDIVSYYRSLLDSDIR